MKINLEALAITVSISENSEKPREIVPTDSDDPKLMDLAEKWLNKGVETPNATEVKKVIAV